MHTVMDVRPDSSAANPLGFTVFAASGEQLTIVAKNLNQVGHPPSNPLLDPAIWEYVLSLTNGQLLYLFFWCGCTLRCKQLSFVGFAPTHTNLLSFTKKDLLPLLAV